MTTSLETSGRWTAYLASVFHATELPLTIVELPRAKQTIEILTMLRREHLWNNPIPESFRSVPNKPILQFNGQPAWAEFILLRLLERGGWNGAWVKNWGGRAFWSNPLQPIELSLSAKALFRRIEKRTGACGGCWDILAWRGDDFLFIESKQHGRDRLRFTQQTWIESALEEGIPLSSFAIVEWLTLI